MRLVNFLAVGIFSIGFGGPTTYAQVQPATTSHDVMDEVEVPEPVWVVGQWWRVRVTNMLEKSPRTLIHRVLEVRRDGYVVQITDESTGTVKATTLVSNKTNFISNAVQGYPLPSMATEMRPDNGKLEFPLKMGAQWERRVSLSNNGHAVGPTLVRGQVSRIVDLETTFGKKKTHKIELWWQSEGAVAYQATCMYLPDIGRCVEYREGLSTATVIEAGIEK